MGSDTLKPTLEELDLLETVRKLEAANCSDKIDVCGLRDALLDSPVEIADIIADVRKRSSGAVPYDNVSAHSMEKAVFDIIKAKAHSLAFEVERVGVSFIQYVSLIKEDKDLPVIKTDLGSSDLLNLYYKGVISVHRVSEEQNFITGSKLATLQTHDGHELVVDVATNRRLTLRLDPENENLFPRPDVDV